MRGKIKGWNFFRGYSADGSTTLENLAAEKKKLEARLAEIPGLISGLNNSISVVTGDLNWVKALDGLKKRRWEKDNNVVAEEWIRSTEATLSKYRSQLESLNAEKSRIPGQIEALQKQIDTLVKGESTGLEKGYDQETARELGKLELEKQKAQMEQERILREAELKAQQESQQQAQKAAEQEKAGQNQTKLFIGIGVGLLLLIAGIILYRRFAAKKAVAV